MLSVDGCTHTLGVVLHADHFDALLVAPRRQLYGPEVELHLFDLFWNALLILVSTTARMWATVVQNGAVGNVLLDGTRVKLGVDVHYLCKWSLQKKKWRREENEAKRKGFK